MFKRHHALNRALKKGYKIMPWTVCMWNILPSNFWNKRRRPWDSSTVDKLLVSICLFQRVLLGATIPYPPSSSLPSNPTPLMAFRFIIPSLPWYYPGSVSPIMKPPFPTMALYWLPDFYGYSSLNISFENSMLTSIDEKKKCTMFVYLGLGLPQTKWLFPVPSVYLKFLFFLTTT